MLIIGHKPKTIDPTIIVTKHNWRNFTACSDERFAKDPDLFFSDDPIDQLECQAFCNTVCPVRVFCLNYALDQKERFGVFGGMTALSRNAVLRKRYRRKCPSCHSVEITYKVIDNIAQICFACGVTWDTKIAKTTR